MKTFTREGLTFKVSDYGNNSDEVVVLLHGFPSNAESWAPVAEKLAQSGYRVLVPEQRGYSQDAQPEKRRDYRLSELVDDIVALIEATGAKNAHIVGHDWGGAVAWAIASEHPEKVASLTVVSTPHPRALVQSLRRSSQILMSWYIFFFQLPRIPEWAMLRNHGKALMRGLVNTGLNRRAATQYVKYMQRKGVLTSALNWYRAIPVGTGYEHPTGIIKPRTMFIYGGKDAYCSHRAAILTRKWVEGSYEFKHLPQETHWIPEQSPAMLADAILGFVRR